MPDADTQTQKLLAFDKVLQAGIAVLLAFCLFFLKDIYGRYTLLEASFRAHELQAESRLSTLEAGRRD